MPLPVRTVSQKFSVRFFLGLTVVVGAYFACDANSPVSGRVLSGAMAVIGALVWVGFEWARSHALMSMASKLQPEVTAPPEAAILRWSMLLLLLLLVGLLPHPGAPAVWSLLFANVRTYTQPARRWKLKLAIGAAAGLSLILVVRAVGATFNPAPISNIEYAAMVLCVGTAVVLPMLSRHLSRPKSA